MGMHYPAIFFNILKAFFQNNATPKTALKKLKKMKMETLFTF